MAPRTLGWITATLFPFVFIPVWIGGWQLAGFSPRLIATATGGLLIAISLIAAFTDSKSARIPNWLTFPGIIWALVLNAIHTWMADESTRQWMGTIGLSESVLGLSILFFGLLVVCSFSGGGAGDVKLVGAVGAFLGLANGFEAILLAYIFAAAYSLINVLSRVFSQTSVEEIKEHDFSEPNEDLGTQEPDESQTLMRQKVRLAPFFALGAIFVLCRETGIIHFSLLGY
jgi:prepilin peptidase CpaA